MFRIWINLEKISLPFRQKRLKIKKHYYQLTESFWNSMLLNHYLTSKFFTEWKKRHFFLNQKHDLFNVLYF